MYTNSDTFLAHHGVKGMKWGVRKSKQQRQKETALKRARKRRAELATPKGKAKDEARTQKYQEKYGLGQKEAQRRQRVQRTQNQKLVKGLVKTGAMVGGYAVANLYLRDLGNAAVGSKQKQAASTRFINGALKTSVKAAKTASRGAKVLFEKDMVVFAPGQGPAPGTYQDAGRVVRELTRGMKALNA